MSLLTDKKAKIKAVHHFTYGDPVLPIFLLTPQRLVLSLQMTVWVKGVYLQRWFEF